MNAGVLLAARMACLAGALATVALMAWAASWSWSGLAFMGALMTWCVSPYVLLGIVSRKPRESRSAAIMLLATALVVAAFAGVVYVDSIFFHPDAQGALVFLFIPVWQGVGAMIGIIVASQLELRARKS